MKHYKKIVGALLALGIGSSAQAATYEKVPPVAECVGENVTVPCEQRGWHVGAQYVYVQPTGDQLYTDLNSQSRWASGFRLEGGYHFGTGNDITANWIYFSKASRRNVVPFNNPLLIADDGNINALLGDAFGPGPFLSAERVESTFNAVNLEFGQLAYWGERVSTRFHAGLQYVSIKRERSHYNSAVAGTGETTTPLFQIPVRIDAANSSSLYFEQKFNGIGPRLGLDAYYTFGESNFSLVGKGAVSVLAADTRVRKSAGYSNLTIDVTSLNPNLPFDFRLLDVNSNVNVPNARTRTLTVGLEAKLGIEYAYPLASGDLIFEGGYQWAAYPQAMLAPSAATVTPTAAIFETAPVDLDPIDLGLGVPGDLNNFGYHGFYVGLRWEGDLA
jgi:hypothetical protein